MGRQGARFPRYKAACRHFEIKGELQDGNLYVNGEAAPLLDELGPEFDEEIDWDAIFAEKGSAE